MQKRFKKWSLVIALGALTLVMGLVAWQYFSGDLLQRFVAQQLQRSNGHLRFQQLQAERTEVRLLGVELESPSFFAGRARLEVELLVVKVNFVDWLRRLLQPDHPVLTVNLSNPILIFSSATSQDSSNVDASPAPDPSERPTPVHAPVSDLPTPVLTNLNWIKLLDTSNGQLIVEDPDTPGRNLIYVAKLNGWIRTADSRTEIKLDGNILNLDSAKVAASAELDWKHTSIDSITFRIDELQLHEQTLGLLPGAFICDRGRLDGEVSLGRDASDRQRLRVSGDLRLVDARFRLNLDNAKATAENGKNDESPTNALASRLFHSSWFSQLAARQNQSPASSPIVVDSVNLVLRLQNDVIEIVRGRQLVNAQPMAISGRVNLGKLSVSVPRTTASVTSMKRLPVRLDSIALPEFDLAFGCDSLVLEEFLAPVLSSAADAALHEIHQPPLRGIAKLRGSLQGSLRTPRIAAQITSPSSFYKEINLRDFIADLSYGSPIYEGETKPAVLEWRAAGRLVERDSTRATPGPTANWKGWGTLQPHVQNQPLDATIVADGQLEPLLNRFFYDSTQTQSELATDDIATSLIERFSGIGFASTTRIIGPVLSPSIRGYLSLNITPAQAVGSKWLGRYTFRDDTLSSVLRVAEGKSVLQASIWRTDGRPVFRVKLLEAQSLPGIIDQRIWGSMAAILGLDVYVEGRVDSLNLRIDGHVGKSGRRLVQVIGYMLPFPNAERLLSGYVKFFPGLANEVAANFVCHWTDSLIKVSEFHCENWLSGAMRLQLHGDQAIEANLRISGAELGRLVEGKDQEHSRFRGKLFGDLKITRSLKDPLATVDLWLMDGHLNDMSLFSGSANWRADRSGWELSRLVLERDQQFRLTEDAAPAEGKALRTFVNATASYHRALDMLQINAKVAELEVEQLLQALFDVPDDIVTGTLSLDVRANGSMKKFRSEAGIPLTGTMKINNGKLLWFGFDTLGAELDADRPGGKYASVSQHGLNLPRGHFLRTDRNDGTKGFRLLGKAFLPFDENREVDVALQGRGNLLAVLPDVSTIFGASASDDTLALKLRGPYPKIMLYDSRLSIRNGRIALSRLAPEVSEIQGEFLIGQDGSFISIPRLRGSIGSSALSLWNVRDTEELLRALPQPVRKPANQDAAATTSRLREELLFADATGSDGLPVHLRSLRTPVIPEFVMPEPLQLGSTTLNLGILLVRTAQSGLTINVPGLMKAGELGTFHISGRGDSTLTWNNTDDLMISGPWRHPRFFGNVKMENTNFQFPFDESNAADDPMLRKVLDNIDWDVKVESGSSTNYVMTVPKALNDVYVSLGIDQKRSNLHFNGIMADSTLRLYGSAYSTHGTIEYLDLNFRVNEFGAEFDASELWPVVYGSAQAVVRDSLTLSNNIFLTLYTRDPVTGQDLTRGRFHNAYFKLSSDAPGNLGLTQEDLLTDLGFSYQSLEESATHVLFSGAYDRLVRPVVIRPVERSLERKLQLDMVRLDSRLAQNYFVSRYNSVRNLSPAGLYPSTMSLLRDSRLMVGKYLMNNLYLQYVGQLEGRGSLGTLGTTEYDVALDRFNEGLQLRHRLGLEYRLGPAMQLHFEYDYNPLLNQFRTDRRIWLRHTFPVDFSSDSAEPGKN